MSTKPLIGLLLAAAAIAPALAQTAAPATSNDGTGRTPQDEYQRGYATTPMPHQDAINAGGAPGTAALNNSVSAADQAAMQQTATAMQMSQADVQAQYNTDEAAYMDALVKHDAAVNRTDARYMHQQHAYADAMMAWRRQVWACKHGHQRACDMPAPDPARFW